MANDLSSIDRLNAMYDLFTTKGNKQLDAGEVDALAGLYCGQKDRGRAKIIDRVVDIYRSASFAQDQKNRFRSLLKGCGLPVQRLEGSGETVEDFLKMSKGAQFERLLEYEQDYQAEFVEEKEIAPDVRARIGDGMKEICAALAKKWKKDKEFELGERKMEAIFMRSQGKKRTITGYVISQQVYAEEHGMDEAYFFNVRGEYVGSDYRGE